MPGARPITFQDVHHDPHAGFSNHASSWRRSVWEDNRFDERLPACEDLDWMWRVMMSGWKVVADPALVVDSGHRRTAGARALWRREYIEHRTVAELVEFPVMGATDVVRIWWNSFPWPSPHPRWLRRMGVGRNVELMAGYLGDKAGQARRDARTLTVPSETPERRCAP